MNKRCLSLTVTAALAAIALLAPMDRAGNNVPASQPSADPLPALATSPERGTSSTAVPIPYRPYMPPAIASHDPRTLPHRDGQHPLKPGRSIDFPSLPQTSLENLPASAHLAVGPAVHLASVSSADIPVDSIAAHPDTARTTLQTDPTQKAAALAAAAYAAAANRVRAVPAAGDSRSGTSAGLCPAESARSRKLAGDKCRSASDSHAEC